MSGIHTKSMRYFALLSLSALAVAGCGNGDSKAADTSGPSLTMSDVKWSSACGDQCRKELELKTPFNEIDCKVGISLQSLKHPYGVAQKAGLEAAAKKYFPNMEFFTTDGQGDAVTQSAQVRDLATRGIKVLLISALESQALVPAVEEVQASGVKVVSQDRSVNTDVITHVAADNIKAGETAGKFIVEQLGAAGGKVVEVAGTLGASATIDRQKGFANVTKGTNVKIIASQTADYQRDQALTVMQDMLQRFPKGQVDLVYTHNDEMALGAIQAIKEAGRQSEIKVVGFDGENQAIKAVADGTYTATVIYPLNIPEAMIAAAKACAGEDMPKRVVLDSPIVTKENAAKFEGTGF
jgi:ribose transport system substrate-binding protein